MQVHREHKGEISYSGKQVTRCHSKPKWKLVVRHRWYSKIELYRRVPYIRYDTPTQCKLHRVRYAERVLSFRMPDIEYGCTSYRANQYHGKAVREACKVVRRTTRLLREI